MLTDKIFAYVGGVVALILALLLAYIWVTKDVEISTLRQSIDDPATGYKIMLANAQMNTATLKGGLQECNSGIEGLKTAGLEASAKANAAIEAASKITANLKQSAADILKAKPSGDLCTSANALILGTLR